MKPLGRALFEELFFHGHSLISYCRSVQSYESSCFSLGWGVSVEICRIFLWFYFNTIFIDSFTSSTPTPLTSQFLKRTLYSCNLPHKIKIKIKTTSATPLGSDHLLCETHPHLTAITAVSPVPLCPASPSRWQWELLCVSQNILLPKQVHLQMLTAMSHLSRSRPWLLLHHQYWSFFCSKKFVVIRRETR